MSRFVSSAAVIIDSLISRNRQPRTGAAAVKGTFRLTMVLALACLLLPGALFGQTLTGTPVTGTNPYAVAVNPVTNTIFVVNNTTPGTVTVINGETNAVQATVTVGTTPTAVAVNVATNMVYVANNGSNTLSYFLGSVTGTPTASSVATGSNPIAVAVDPGAGTNGQVYVANKTTGSPSVMVFSGASTPASVATVTTPNSPYAIAINPVNHEVYVGSAGVAVLKVAYFNGSGVTTGTASTVSLAASNDSPQSLAVNPVTGTVYAASNSNGTVIPITGCPSACVAGTAITVGTKPVAVAVNPVTNTIYVVNQPTPIASTAGSVSVINGSNNTVTATVTVGDGPQALAINPVTNFIYVSSTGGTTVKAINGATNAVSSVSLGASSSPAGIAVNPVTNKVYATVPGFSTPYLAVIDGAKNTTSSVSTGSTPVAVAVNSSSNTIFTVDSAGPDVTVINGATGGVLGTVTVGNGPNALAIDPVVNQIFVTNGTDGTMTVIDGVAGEGYPTTTVTVKADPVAVAVNPVTNIAYVASNGNKNISIYDEATGATTFLSMGANATPSAIAVNPVTNTIYVADNTNNTVVVVNGATNTVTATVAVGANPSAIAVNPVTNFIYVGCASSLRTINGATNTQVSLTIASGANPFSIAVNTVTNTVYTANQGNATVSVIAGATASVAASISATLTGFTTPVSVAVNPATNAVYVADSGAGDVFWIDGATNNIATITAGTTPAAVAVNPETNVAYAVNSGSNNVTVITPNAISSIPLGVSALSFTSTGTVNNLAMMATTNASPAFSATVTSTSPYSTASMDPTALYYQLDTAQGVWASATDTSGAGANPATFTFSLSSVPLGVHILYTYPAYGGQGVPESNGIGSGNSPEIGNLTAYPFIVLSQTASAVSVALTTGSSTAVYGTSLTYTATVTPSSGPTGSVTFYSGSMVLCAAATLSSGTATCTTTAVPVGTDYITAVYSGDGTYTWSESAPITQTITVATPTAAITPSPVSTVYGSVTPITVTATFTGAGAADSAPSGVVTFTAATGTIGGTFSFTQSTGCTSATDVLTCTATYTPSGTLAVNSYASAFSAKIAAAGNYGASATATQSLSVTAATPAISVGSMTSTYGSTTNVTATITVTGVAGGSNLTGGVTCAVGSNLDGSCAVSGCTTGSSITCTATWTPGGTVAKGTYTTNTITATIAAAGNYGTATSAPNSVTVNGETPAISVGAMTTTFGSTTGVTSTVTVTGVAGGTNLTGTVTCASGTTTGGSCAVTGCTTGSSKTCTATWTPTGTLAAGTYTTNTITATIAAAGNYDAATSAANTVTVGQQTPTVAAGTATPNSVVYGLSTPITFTGTLAWTGSGAIPTGSPLLAFSSNAGGTAGTPSCPGATSPITCSVTYTPSATDTVGTTKSIVATYAGDSNYATATNTAASAWSVVKQTPTVTVNAGSPSSITYGSATPITITATLAWLGSGTAPANSLGFTSTATGTFGTPSCPATATPITCTVTFTPDATNAAGSYAVTASYTTDARYNAASNTNNSDFTITAATPNAAVAAVSIPYGSTTPVSVIATFTGAGSGESAPSGVVTFTANTGTIGGLFSFTQASNCTTATDVYTCTGTYTPSGTLPFLTGGYTSAFSASIAAAGNYGASPTANATLTISRVAPTVATTPNPLSLLYGSTNGVTMTSTATGPGSADAAPTGTVTFTANVAVGGSFTGTVSCGSATDVKTCTQTYLPSGTLAVGSYSAATITSHIVLGTNYSAATSPNITVNVTPATPTVSISPSPATTTYGSTAGVSLTITVTGAGAAAAAPSGAVSLSSLDGSVTTPSCSTSGDVVTCTATYTPSGSLAPGTYSSYLSVGVAADSNYNSASGADDVLVNQGSTTTSVASGQNPTVYGQSVTFTATVSAPNGLVRKGRSVKPGVHSLDVTGNVTWSANTGCGTTSVTFVDAGDSTATCMTSSLGVGTDAITAQYNGDSNHTGSLGTLGGGQMVNQASTTTTLGADNNPSTYGQLVTFTATVAPVSPGAGTPTGSVAIVDTSNGNAAVCTITLSGGTGTCSSAALAVGGHNLSANYPGDTNFMTSSGMLAQTVNAASSTTTTTLTSGTNPSTYGGSVMFTANITGQNGAIRKAGVHRLDVTGTVTWSANTGCSASTVSGYPGMATCTTSTLPAGSETVTATYSGDSNHTGSNGSVMQTVTAAMPSAAITPSPVTTPYASTTPVSVVATFAGTGVSGDTAPTGTVTFTRSAAVGGTLSFTQGTNCVTGGTNNTSLICTASYTPSGTLAVNTYANAFSASIAAGGSYGAAGPATDSLMVMNQASTTVLTATPNPSTGGQSVAFKATVTPAPTGASGLGSIVWTANGTSIGSQTFPFTNNGSLTLNYAGLLPSGSPYNIVATYSGGSLLTGSTSNTVVQTVSLEPTTTNLTAPATSTYGASVTLSATVASTNGVTPTGTVAFKNGATTIGTGTLSGSGSTATASIMYSGLPVGADMITANYSGTSYLQASSSSASTVTVSKASSTTAVTTSGTPSTYGTAVTFTAAVAPVAPATSTPSGTVQFKIDGSNFGSPVQLSTSVSGQATSSPTSTLSVGTHTVTAVYSGDTDYTTSTGTLSGGQVVNAASITVTIAPNPVSIKYGSTTPVSVVATFAGPGTLGTTVPSGTVTFTAATGTIGGTFSFTQGTNCAAGGTNGASLICTATYTPSGSLAANTYASAFSASIAAGGNYAAGGPTTDSLVITNTATPTVTITPNPVSVKYGSTTAVSVVATFAGSGVSGGTAPSGTVTFTAATGTVGGSFTFTQGTNCVTGGTNNTSLICTGSYTPSGTLAAGSYASAFSASIAAGGDYGASGTANDSLTITNTATPTASITPSPVTLTYGSVTPVSVVATFAGTGISGGSAPSGTVTFATSGIDGTLAFNQGANCVTGGTNNTSLICTGTYMPSGVLAGGTYTGAFTASIAAGGNYGASGTASDTLHVTAQPTSTALTAMPNPSTGGQSVAFKATVTPAPTGAAGQGTITWTANGNVIGSQTFPYSNNGSLTLNYSGLTPGSYNVVASYSGGTNLNASTSNTVVQVVNVQSTTTTLAVSNTSPTYGQSITLTATVTASNGVTPTGNVTFNNGSTVVGTVALTASGTAGTATAALAISNLPVGADSVTANYTGSTLMQASSSSATTVNVAQATTTTTLTSSPNPSATGQSVTFTATVAPQYAGIAPTGTVTFFAGLGTQMGTITLNGSGVAVLSYSSLNVGTTSITAVYSGSTNFAGGNSNSVAQLVNQTSTTTMLSSNLGSTTYGQAVMFTATVTATAGTPVGSVQFKNGSTLLGTSSLSGGVATLTTGALPVGSDSVTAYYLGTGLYTASQSSAVGVGVSQATSGTALAANPTSSTGGQSVAFTATVTPQYGGAVTGSVVFKDGATTIGTVSINASGVAVLNYSALLPSGSPHSITAAYGGSTNVGASTSTALSYTVTLDTTTTVLTTNPNPSTHGNAVVLTATVTPGNGAAATGTVSFYKGTTLLGNATLSGGVATLSHTFATAGSYTLKAVYAGSSYKSGSTSATVTQTVD